MNNTKTAEMNYEETIEYLYAHLPTFHRDGQIAFKAGLQNITALCEALGNPQNKFKSIHVAGTNGKGSTSHLLAAILQTAGYKTGLHTSPHLKSYTERFKINGKLADEQLIIDFVEKYKILIESIKPSFFEISVALAFDYFAREKVDIAIIEVGLGGRLDSTNIITPILSVITNISFDHTAILGNTLPEIASEKAGIIKSNVPVVISETQAEIVGVFTQKAKKENTSVIFADQNYRLINKETSKKGRRVVDVFKDEKLEIESLEIDLVGNYQTKNILGVFQAVEVLRNLNFEISNEQIKEAVSQTGYLTNFKGRWQVLGTEPLIIVDVAHNEAGLKEIINQIQQTPYEQLHFVLGFVKDKDITTILNLFTIFKKPTCFYFCQFDSPRTLPVEELLAIASTFNLFGTSFQNPNDALEAAKKAANKNDLIYVGGSTFVLSELNEI